MNPTLVEKESLFVKGDPQLFLTHLRKLLPVERDQKILLGFMAACVQMRGVKFCWAPLIQGGQGNGKTLFANLVAHIIGAKHSYYPNAISFCNKFNDWIDNKNFVVIEGVASLHFAELMETLTPLITERNVEIHSKGREKRIVDNRANFILISSDKRFQKPIEDRRICHFRTAQQSREDLIRDGMGDEYFQKLNDWLICQDGYAIVAEYLANYEIADEFNPTKMSCAPFIGDEI